MAFLPVVVPLKSSNALQQMNTADVMTYSIVEAVLAGRLLFINNTPNLFDNASLHQRDGGEKRLRRYFTIAPLKMCNYDESSLGY